MAERYRLDPDELSPADLKRARAGPLEGRDPYELLNGKDTGDRLTLVMWCLLSRDQPELSWAEAERAPFKAFDSPLAAGQDKDGDEPPLTDSNDGPGGSDARIESASDGTTRSGRRRGSAAGTASAPRSTTG
jgi:hypothetical protein